VSTDPFTSTDVGERAPAGLKGLLFSESLLGILSKVITYAGGFVSAFLAGLFLTPGEQGLFFSFLSFAMLYVFVELGLNTVIVQFTSHEKALVDSAKNETERSRAASRLVSVGRFAFFWFGIGAVLFALLTGPFGLLFFRGELSAVAVPGPWLCLAILAALDIALFPFWSLLEGSGEIRAVYAYRCVRAIAMTVGTSLSLAAGAQLWSLAVGFAATLPVSASVLLQYRRFFRRYWVASKAERVSWSREMLPLQWRLALSWLAGYLAAWAITPVTLKMFGPEAAGQIGMTWAVAAGVGAIASSVVQVKAPLFGTLVATRCYSELDRLAFRQGLLSIGLASMGAIAALGLVYSLAVLGHPLAARFLPLGPMALILAAAVLMQITVPMSVYLRAHKREPYLWLSLAYAACSLLAAVILGRLLGVAGIPVAYFSTAALLALPWGTVIFLRCRRQWHRDSP